MQPKAPLWLNAARGHLTSAELEGLDERHRCFHSQRAVELAVKALLFQYGIGFPFTHEIDALLGLVPGGVPEQVSNADISRPMPLKRCTPIPSPASIKTMLPKPSNWPSANSVYYPTFNARGDITTLRSASGQVTEINYSPWGVSARSTSSASAIVPFEYDGRDAVLTQPELDGLIWMRARHYDPKLGTFLQADPLPTQAGTADTTYSYAGNDPVNQKDPTGRTCITGASKSSLRSSDGNGHGAPSLIVWRQKYNGGKGLDVDDWSIGGFAEFNAEIRCNNKLARVIAFDVQIKIDAKPWLVVVENATSGRVINTNLSKKERVRDKRTRKWALVVAEDNCDCSGTRWNAPRLTDTVFHAVCRVCARTRWVVGSRESSADGDCCTSVR